MCRVKHIGEPKEPGDVYIGRPSKWGNPFNIGIDGSRAEVIALHAHWLTSRKDLWAQLPELRGKNLICYCAPKQCHGDTLLKLANQEDLS